MRSRRESWPSTCTSPFGSGGEHRSGETLCAVKEPARAHAFLKAEGVAVTPKPEGVRIATHFFNDERDVDRCIEALVQFTKTT